MQSGQRQFAIQIPSNYRSLRSAICVFRPASVESNYTTPNKHITYQNFSDIKINWRLNGFQLYQQDLTKKSELFQEMRRIFGNRAVESKFYDAGSEFDGDKFILCGRFNSLNDAVTGSQTSSHVSSLELLLDTGTPLAENLRADIYLVYDKLLSVANGSMQVVE